MIAAAISGLTAGKLVQVVLGALAAGLGVTVAFSLLIYCADRALQLRRHGRSEVAWSAAAGFALLACLALIAAGMVLVASKPK